MTDNILPRTELVNLLLQKLSNYRIIQVTQSATIASRTHVPPHQIRGTPACGKSILCNLLHLRLKKEDVLAYTIQGWKTDKHYSAKLQEICGTFLPTRPTYLLFDEAQDTYRDPDLWNYFFKMLRGKGNLYVALRKQ